MAEKLSRRDAMIGGGIIGGSFILGFASGGVVGRLTAPTQGAEQSGLLNSEQGNKKEIQSDNILAISIGNHVRQFLTPPLLTELESGVMQAYTPALFRDVSVSHRIVRDKIEGPLDFRFACFDSNKCSYQLVPGKYVGVAELPIEAYKAVGSYDVQQFVGLTTLFMLQENGLITEDKYLANPRRVTMFSARVRKAKTAPEIENSAEFYNITLNKPWKIVGDTAIELPGDLQFNLLKDSAQVGEPVALIEEIYPIGTFK